jgi:hypothetical protein
MNKALKKKELDEQFSLFNIAIVKSHAYCMDYDSNSGREVEKTGARFLKEGYVDGFLAGFAHRMGGGHGGD